ncbi:MAG: hypothetical protein ACI840_002443 [Ulvibacter sp.]|jgi:hypothetical protein
MKKWLLIIFLLPISLLFSQENKVLNPERYDIKPFVKEGFVIDHLSLTTMGFGATGDNLPFWMYRNTNGRIDAETNVAGLLRGSISYYLSDRSYFELGAGAIASNGNKNSLRRDELYISYVNPWLKVTLGSKTPFQEYQGLSVVAKDFLLSGNARALPGLIVEAPEPFMLSNTFGIDWGIAHYELNEERYVDNPKVHYKRLGLVVNLDRKNQLVGGIEHYAQWGGTSPVFGKLPSSFSDFLQVFIAGKSEGDTAIGETLNSLGNHLGIYNFEYNFTPSSGRFSFYHQHPFEDGSGTAFKNFPDGIWGFYFGPNTADFDSFITGFLLEYVQTTDQSGSGRPDNYFSNSIYRSGWTYHNNTIGLPFIIPFGNPSFIAYNRTRAINVGFAARNGNLSFKSKTSFTQNTGSFAIPIEPEEFAIYNYLNTTYSIEKYGNLSLLLGFDYSDQNKDTFGAGLTYTYSY